MSNNINGLSHYKNNNAQGQAVRPTRAYVKYLHSGYIPGKFLPNLPSVK